jgi:hypothetical protein
MRTPDLIPTDTIRKTTKSIVNRNPKESNNPRFHWRLNLMENHLNMIESKEEWTLVHSRRSRRMGRNPKERRRLKKV